MTSVAFSGVMGVGSIQLSFTAHGGVRIMSGGCVPIKGSKPVRTAAGNTYVHTAYTVYCFTPNQHEQQGIHCTDSPSTSYPCNAPPTHSTSVRCHLLRPQAGFAAVSYTRDNHSIHRSTNQSVKHAIHESIDQLTKEPSGQSTIIILYITQLQKTEATA